MKKIRRNIFETNSSSSHSIVISIDDDGNGDYCYNFWDCEDGVLNLYPGDFNWGLNTHRDPYTKASYIYTYALRKPDDYEREAILKRLKGVIKDMANLHVEFCLLDEDKGKSSEEGYIDHESVDVGDKVAKTEEQLIEFLFNTNIILLIDNDNH